MRFVSYLTFIIIILTYVRCQERLRRPLQSDNEMIKKTIKQPLDHFDKNENRTFNFRYYTKYRNNKSQPNAPIYLWIPGFIDRGYHFYFLDNDLSLVDQMALETNGSVYTLFRRYINWGEIYLQHDKNYFKYLTIEQILADYANLIKYLKSQPGRESSKVVLLGTYEGGREATWMRMKYPELVDAVVAANAPLLAKKDFNEYFNVIRSAYEKYGPPDCLNKIERHYNYIEKMSNTTNGIRKIIKEYYICDDVDFTSDLDRSQFWYIGVYYPYCTVLTMNTESYVKYACRNIQTLELQRPVPMCNHAHVGYWQFYNYINHYLYLQCSEIGQFPTTSLETKPFGNLPLDFHLKLCNVLFGIDEKTMDEGIAKTNEKFGGVTPDVTNVVFTYGELDASRLLGVTKNLSDTVVSFVLDGVGSYSVPYIIKYEPKVVTETRKAVASLIIKWISA